MGEEQTPRLGIATLTEQKDSITDEPVAPESLKDTVNEKVLEYFRDWEASEVVIGFRTKHQKNFNEFYKLVEA
ncbi:hypothetical protein FACS1894176_00700 [Bacteroidia bacterium]|nr:hypothetical protein FACS1894176_00700 [Bacteroidia bacterium]